MKIQRPLSLLCACLALPASGASGPPPGGYQELLVDSSLDGSHESIHARHPPGSQSRTQAQAAPDHTLQGHQSNSMLGVPQGGAHTRRDDSLPGWLLDALQLPVNPGTRPMETLQNIAQSLHGSRTLGRSPSSSSSRSQSRESHPGVMHAVLGRIRQGARAQHSVLMSDTLQPRFSISDSLPREAVQRLTQSVRGSQQLDRPTTAPQDGGSPKGPSSGRLHSLLQSMHERHQADTRQDASQFHEPRSSGSFSVLHNSQQQHTLQDPPVTAQTLHRPYGLQEPDLNPDEKRKRRALNKRIHGYLYAIERRAIRPTPLRASFHFKKLYEREFPFDRIALESNLAYKASKTHSLLIRHLSSPLLSAFLLVP